MFKLTKTQLIMGAVVSIEPRYCNSWGELLAYVREDLRITAPATLKARWEGIPDVEPCTDLAFFNVYKGKRGITWTFYRAERVHV